jgi:hypothetical protein
MLQSDVFFIFFSPIFSRAGISCRYGVHQVSKISMYIYLPFKSDNLVDPSVLLFQSQK